MKPRHLLLLIGLLLLGDVGLAQSEDSELEGDRLPEGDASSTPVSTDPETGLTETVGQDWSADKTVITARQVEMFSGDSVNRFLFNEDVLIRSTNLRATCDTMEVLADRANVAGQAADESQARMGSIRNIVMTGRVRIEQSGRVATSGKALILPLEGRVELTDGPEVTDGEGTVTGWKMVLYKDERRVQVLSRPASEGQEGGRTRISLPPIQDLGYRDPEQQIRQGAERPSDAEAGQ